MFLKYPQIPLILSNTPKNPYLQRRASIGIPGHDLLFNGIKQVPDENELMFGGSDSNYIGDYFGNQGRFWAFV